MCKNISIHVKGTTDIKWNFRNESTLSKAQDNYTKPGLQAEKNRAHHKYKENLAMMDCLDILYPV